jgi:predicted DNA-binding transcriptional regulator AlpA
MRRGTMAAQEWISVRDFAGKLGVTRAWVYELIATGKLSPTQLRRRRTTVYAFDREYVNQVMGLVKSGVPLSEVETSDLSSQ